MPCIKSSWSRIVAAALIDGPENDWQCSTASTAVFNGDSYFSPTGDERLPVMKTAEPKERTECCCA
jgi:hypothetical protein